jgi:hypothetical protein
MFGGRRRARWELGATPLVHELYLALIDLIADIGEPAVVVLDACERFDLRITRLDRWMLAQPCPDPGTERAVRELVGACAGLWATTVHVARLSPAGIDAGSAHLPPYCASDMSARVDALEDALEGVRRLHLL